MKQGIKTLCLGMIKDIRGMDTLFWLLLIVFAAIPLLYFSYIPIWDGWQFSRCYMRSALEGSVDCERHSAFLHTLIYSTLQRVDLGNFQLIYAMNLLFGVAGLISFRSLLGYLFGGRLSSVNLTLLTFCFGLNPVFLVHVVQPCLDFTLPVLLVIVILSLFRNRFYCAAAAGVLIVFTKESGFMLYGVSVFLFLALMILKDPSLFKEKIEYAKKTGVLIVPAIFFAVYMVLVPHTQIGDSWTEGIRKMFRFYLLDKVMAAQLISLFVINFNWVISAAILINIGVVSAAFSLKSLRGRGGVRTVFNNRFEGIYFYVLFFAIVYFLTRIPFVNNPRYMLPALPLLIVLFGAALINIVKKQALITAALAAMLVLLILSSFRTLDPVSKKAMGTFRFGSHEILYMTSYENPFHGYGRDQLVYNFEFTEFHYLTEKIVKEFGWSNFFIIPPGVTYMPDFGAFDVKTGHRSIVGERLKSLQFHYSNKIISGEISPEEFYYISYPNFDRNNVNINERGGLSYTYDLKDVIRVENNGYSVDVYRYVKKNDR